MPQTQVVTIGEATYTLINTMWADVVQITLLDKYKNEKRRDRGYWSDFLVIAPYIQAVEGWAWEPITDTITAEELDARYRALLSHLDGGDFDHLIESLQAMRAPKGGVLDKPDAALTDAERADPN